MNDIYEMPFEQFVEWVLSDEPPYGTPFTWMKAWAKRCDKKVAQLEAENERLREAVEFAKSLCYMHSDGDDLCQCEVYNAALEGE